jgi:hypothetical protein
MLDEEADSAGKESKNGASTALYSRICSAMKVR